MKLRPGDQPLPDKNDLPFVQDAVIADIEARKAVGIERYGTPLQAFNGRDALRDAYEEAIDLSMYLKQAILERDGEMPVPMCARCGKPWQEHYRDGGKFKMGPFGTFDLIADHLPHLSGVHADVEAALDAKAEDERIEAARLR